MLSAEEESDTGLCRNNRHMAITTLLTYNVELVTVYTQPSNHKGGGAGHTR